jgi:hypothetical protein
VRQLAERRGPHADARSRPRAREAHHARQHRPHVEGEYELEGAQAGCVREVQQRGWRSALPVCMSRTR